MAEQSAHVFLVRWLRRALGFDDVDDVATYIISMASTCVDSELEAYVGELAEATPAELEAFVGELRGRLSAEAELLSGGDAPPGLDTAAPAYVPAAIGSGTTRAAAPPSAPTAAMQSSTRRVRSRTTVEWREPVPDDFDLSGPVYNCAQCGCVMWLELHGRTKPCTFCATPLDTQYIQRKYYPETMQGGSLPKRERRRLAEERSATEERRRAAGKTTRDAFDREKRELALSAARAEKLKERLLAFDRDRSARSRVFDDDNDYFESSTSVWSTTAERAAAGNADEQRRAALQKLGRGPGRGYAIDVANRRMVDAPLVAARADGLSLGGAAAAVGSDGFSHNETLSGKAEEVYLRIQLRRREAEAAAADGQGAKQPARGGGGRRATYAAAAARRARLQHVNAVDVDDADATEGRGTDAGADADADADAGGRHRGGGGGSDASLSPRRPRSFISAIDAAALLDAVILLPAAAARSSGGAAAGKRSHRAARIAKVAQLVRESAAAGADGVPSVIILVGATRSTVEGMETALRLAVQHAPASGSESTTSVLFTGGDMFSLKVGAVAATASASSYSGSLVAEVGAELLAARLCSVHVAFQNERHCTSTTFYPSHTTYFLSHNNDMHVVGQKKKNPAKSLKTTMTTTTTTTTELHCGGGHTLYSGFALERLNVGGGGDTQGDGSVRRRALGALADQLDVLRAVGPHRLCFIALGGGPVAAAELEFVLRELVLDDAPHGTQASAGGGGADASAAAWPRGTLSASCVVLPIPSKKFSDSAGMTAEIVRTLLLDEGEEEESDATLATRWAVVQRPCHIGSVVRDQRIVHVLTRVP